MSPRRLLVACLLFVLTTYQRLVSPLLHAQGGGCRFHPSCSHYAREALLTHGPLRGLALALRRLGRCHPFGGHGVDPVPAPKDAA